jgi:hypothetical protein
MKFLFLMIMISFVSVEVQAALSIKPGLWTIQSKVKRDGKEFDPNQMMKDAMAQMTPEQRKQVEAMMNKMSGGKGPAMKMGEKGIQVCYTSELLKNEEMLNQHKDQSCTSTFPVKTSTNLVVEFKCKNGTNGKADWKVKDSTHYIGKVTVTEGNGNATEIDYQAEFSSANCGAVKPVSPTAFKK